MKIKGHFFLKMIQIRQHDQVLFIITLMPFWQNGNELKTQNRLCIYFIRNVEDVEEKVRENSLAGLFNEY